MKLVAVITLYFLYSCSENKTIQKCPVGSFKSDIPAAFGDSGFVQRKQKLLKSVGLAPLTQGFSQMQVRIWYGYPYSDRDNLLLFSKTADKWKGEIWEIKYWSKIFDGKDSVFADKRNVTPRCGWNLFMDSLINHGLLTLKDCSNIPGYSCEDAGNNIIVEFASCDAYRIYHLSEPSLRAAKFEEAKSVTEISTIIERQLSFRRLFIEK